jgi:hypothetical protein
MSRTALLAALAAALLVAVAPARALADVDPAGCTDSLQYDPSIPTYNSVLGLPLGGGLTGTGSRRPTADLQAYQHAVAVATQNNPRVRVIEKKMADSALGRQVIYSVVGTPDNIANLDAGRNDAAFWEGVREGTISEPDGLSQVRSRPAFTWVTATPHGNEPAAGEASMRLLYELTARLDCANARRLQNLDTFIVPVTNPDGRDLNQRTTAWGFDPNRDRGTRVNQENDGFLRDIAHYPGVFVIDAHQQSNGYFFPPDEDGVHHEISAFALNFIQNDIGPMLQRMFNDQSTIYQNYNTYDLFAPEYGDSVPTLLDGAAGMTYEKGSSENYGKQVYDHYLAMDATENITSDRKADILSGWVAQWSEALEQGRECVLQPNKLVSPLHTEIRVQPDWLEAAGGPPAHVCGYFFPPGEHSGDTARLLDELQNVGVHIYRIDRDTTVAGMHVFGPTGSQPGLIKAGTVWVPMAQGQKHWIQAILGENPYLPFPYNYDVTTWSYPLTRGLTGSGFLASNLPDGTPMTEITDPGYGTVTGAGSRVYAFDTDSAAALGMVTELLDKGATVYRGATAFTAGGRSFASGAALVDGASLQGIDLAAIAAARETPVVGLDRYPVQRLAMGKPHIGIFTGTADEQPSPIGIGNGGTGSCSSGYCEALFVLTQKNKVPADMITPVSANELAAGKLTDDTQPGGRITAFIFPPQNRNLPIQQPNPPTPPDPTIQKELDNIKAFVNAGGRYIGTTTAGVTTARNAGVTDVNTASIPGISTPGTLYDGSFDTSNPLSWGFDRPPGTPATTPTGWIYRDLGSNPNFDPATLQDNGNGFVAASAAASFAAAPGKTSMYSYGYDVNAEGPGQLPGRPAMVDQPFGAGHALLLGVDPFYRAWVDEEERIVLNGALYPTTTPIAPDAAPAAVRAAAQQTAAAPLPAARLAKPVKAARAKGTHNAGRDLLIKVRKADGAKLRRAVKAAHLTRKLRKKVRYVKARTTVSLVMRNVRSDANEENRQLWTGRIMGSLQRRGVRALVAQI